jgi:hypothetical protein
VNLNFLLFINATVIQNVLEGVIGVTLGSGGWLAGAAVVVVKVVRESRWSRSRRSGCPRIKTTP